MKFEMRDVEVGDLFLLRAAFSGLELSTYKKALERYI
jgi:hypothetical protein